VPGTAPAHAPLPLLGPGAVLGRVAPGRSGPPVADPRGGPLITRGRGRWLRRGSLHQRRQRHLHIGKAPPPSRTCRDRPTWYPARDGPGTWGRPRTPRRTGAVCVCGPWPSPAETRRSFGRYLGDHLR
jgi:hypothetical protein